MKGKRGFAAMSVDQRKRIARLGGKKVQALGKAYKWTSETARDAGRLGGKASILARRKRVSL